MNIEIVQTSELTSYVGVRAVSAMDHLGVAVNRAFEELIARRNEINNIKNHRATYGITPPNYKGSNGLLDFYCCYEVEPLANLPHGMVHIHLPPRMYSLTHYKGSASQTHSAYDFTTKWLSENGYAYDDVSYYFEKYDEKTLRDPDDERNECLIYCPIKRNHPQDEANKSRILNVASILFVSDRQRTLDYYTKLGFSCDASFGFVQRDGFEFIVHETKNASEIKPNFPIHREDALDLFSMVAGVEKLYEEFKSKGAQFRYPLRITEFGMKEFAIQDPDGYSLGFGESIIG